MSCSQPTMSRVWRLTFTSSEAAYRLMWVGTSHTSVSGDIHHLDVSLTTQRVVTCGWSGADMRVGLPTNLCGC